MCASEPRAPLDFGAPGAWNPAARRIARRSAAWLCAVLALVVPAVFAETTDGPRSQRVLVLQSYPVGDPFSDSTRLGLSEVFAASGLDIDVFVEALDVNRIAPEEQVEAAMAEMLRAKYASITFDVVVACDNDALAFLRLRRDRLFPGVPVVFVGVNRFTPAMVDERTDVTGVTGNRDYGAAIATIRHVQPEVRTIVAIVDDTTTGRAERESFQAASRAAAGVAVRFLSLGDTSLEGMGDALAALSPDTAVLLLHCSVDRNGTAYTSGDTTRLLSRRASVPIYVVSEIRVGQGALGGMVTSGQDVGAAAARMVVSILRGTDVRAIPVVPVSPARLLFDDTVMRRFGISERALPEGRDIINHPPTIIDQYRTQVIVAGVAFAVVLLLLGALGFEVFRRRRVEATLRKSQSALAGILNSVPQGIFWKNRDGVYLGCNQVFATAAGCRSSADVVGKTDFDLSPSESIALAYRAEDAEVVHRGLPKRHVIEHAFEAGNRRRWIDTTKIPLTDDTGSVYGVLGIYDDISDRRQAEAERARLEEQLQQAVKMEAVGRLAGGVAHDFNNLLTAISGNLELADEALTSPEALAVYLEEARKAADSAAGLTRQLLAFSRKQLIEPRVVDLNALVGHLRQMLGRLIGEDVDLGVDLAPGLGAVKVDPGQFEQALVNLVVNARDAMPDGGVLRIQTANAELDAHDCALHPPTTPGHYVMVAVSDTGTGMSEDVKSHLFEPFFTTKPRGQGTGLGLATTFGTVAQAGGMIDVQSELGAGTTFRIYLPRVESAPAAAAPAVGTPRVGGHESLMLVEDNDAVRSVTVTMLERLGYGVRSAASGAEALRLAADREHPLDLLVTDVVMPGMNGRELAERLIVLYPDLRVLFASGYTDDDIVRRGLVNEHLQFIGKPYSMEGLAAKIRLALDRRA